MKLIKPSFEILEQKPRAIAIPDDMEIGPRKVREELLNSIYRQIEIAGRICYKSEDKITEDSAKSFVERMIKAGHGAMLEHGTVYLSIPYNEAYSLLLDTNWVIDSYGKNPYSIIRLHGPYFYITTNYRVLVENGWLDDLKYLCEPTEYHAKRITVHFVCDRGVSHEFVRHRVFSFAQESTRYCNYSKDKFDSECTFIIPCWLNIVEGSYTLEDVEEKYDRCLITDSGKGITNEAAEYIRSLIYSEKTYFSLLDRNWRPQQARAVLPNSLKTELVMTGFVSDWKHFFELRCSSSAHPQARELAIPLQEEFIARGYINN